MASTETIQSERVAEPRHLYRSRTEKVLGGVCGGLGDYLAVDPVWLRIGFVALALGGGSGVLVYLLMWLIVPEEPEGYTPTTTARAEINGAAVVGIGLILVGTIALVNTVAPWLGQYFWPVILVVGGLALVIGGLNRDNR